MQAFFRHQFVKQQRQLPQVTLIMIYRQHHVRTVARYRLTASGERLSFSAFDIDMDQLTIPSCEYIIEAGRADADRADPSPRH